MLPPVIRGAAVGDGELKTLGGEIHWGKARSERARSAREPSYALLCSQRIARFSIYGCARFSDGLVDVDLAQAGLRADGAEKLHLLPRNATIGPGFLGHGADPGPRFLGA